jgi:hypothetical protein
VGSSELGPIYRRTGHPSSCRPRRTDRVVERRSEEPPLTARIRRCHTTVTLSAVRAHRGTEISNPFPSSGESANHRFLSDGAKSAEAPSSPRSRRTCRCRVIRGPPTRQPVCGGGRGVAGRFSATESEWMLAIFVLCIGSAAAFAKSPRPSRPSRRGGSAG